MTGLGARTTGGQLRTPPAPRQFTFINQHEDVQSIQERRVHNEGHRTQIKSHAMRGVRRDEHQLGKKRPTGHPPLRTGSTAGATTQTIQPTNADNTVEIARRSSSPGERTFRVHDESMARGRSQYTCPPQLRLTHAPSNHCLDPFETIPIGSTTHASIQEILEYCISDSIPMSFPAEWREPDKEARIEMLVSARNHSPAGFLGLLATNAAHRAIVSYQRHDDLSPSDRSHADLIHDSVYRSVLKDAYQALRNKQDKGELDAEFLEACFGLICAQTIVGDFSKSRILQRYVQQVLQTITIPKDSQAWLPLVDMSTAMGMLSRPTIVLPWDRAPVLDETLVRIHPTSDLRLSRLGVAFANATHITPQLRQLLENAVILCQFAEYHDSHSQGLGYYDHIMYRCKYYELHQDLLSYVYDVFPCTEDEPSALLVPVPALEQVIRLAMLGMISNTMVVAHPATGLGRALTHHQKNALEFYGLRFTPAMDRAELKIMLWALLVYAACALEQVEAKEFESKIAQACVWLDLDDWEPVENVLTQCLYIPSMQGKVWRALWQRAEQEAATLRTTQIMTTQQWMLVNRERIPFADCQ